MKRKPYVCVTGPTEVDHVEMLSAYFKEAGFDEYSSHIGMLGFLITDEVMDRGWSDDRRNVRKNNLRPLLEASDVSNALHYHTKNFRDFTDDVKELFSLDDIYDDDLCRILQFNSIPFKEHIEIIRGDFPELEIILTIHPNIVQDIFRESTTIPRGPGFYENIDYILLDPSRGRGLQMDMEKTSEELKFLSKRLDATIGISGGLYGGNVQEAIKKTESSLGSKKFSVDAQTKLRTEEEGRKLTELDPEKGGRFIRKSAENLLD